MVRAVLDDEFIEKLLIPWDVADAHHTPPFAPALAHWLENSGQEAVLIRPDRYVFGSGAPQALMSSYNDQLDID